MRVPIDPRAAGVLTQKAELPHAADLLWAGADDVGNPCSIEVGDDAELELLHVSVLQ